MFHFTSNMFDFVVDLTERNLRCLWTVTETRKTNGTGSDSHTYSQGTDLLQIEGMKEVLPSNDISICNLQKYQQSIFVFAFHYPV